MEAAKIATESESELLKIEATILEKLNLADFQNSVPVIQSLKIISLGASTSHLELSVFSNPSFFKERIWRIESIASEATLNITDIDVRLDGTILAKLTESELATIFFELRDATTASVLSKFQINLELLPRNHWAGISHYPQLIAAYVQPNDPTVDRILKQTAEILRANGKPAGIDGYTGSPKRVWELSSAIWTAVGAMQLEYSLPPASFEKQGQKVRSPTQISDVGIGTCLDLALLFCSVLEQAGLNPIMVFIKGHAFAGVWLKNEDFSHSVVDDVTALRKRAKLNEIILFESTLVTHRPTPPFSFAIETGIKHLDEQKVPDFEIAIDIKRSRLQRVKPLSTISEFYVKNDADQDSNESLSIEDAPELLIDSQPEVNDSANTGPADKLSRWQRKLLDLSLRNNLLNFKSGKKAIKLEAPDASLLEDELANGQVLKLQAKVDLMEGGDPRNRNIHQGRDFEDLEKQYAIDALNRHEVNISLSLEELDSRLLELYRSSRSTMQEGGANTLFLAFGFLSWFPTDKNESSYRAPLVLLPVTLNRKSARSGFTLSIHDDEARLNSTLLEMLRQDFNLNLNLNESELPKDQSGLDLKGIWTSVSASIKDIKGWELIEEVVLSNFSFAKHLMWKDLTERTDQLRQNSVVRHLLDTHRDAYSCNISFPSPRKLDSEFAAEKIFCPLPADSSQLSAIMAASRGKDFVLIGPPGTGKSQTIVNIISQFLAEGKRILFVSEKIAALDVVHRRLREVELGEFCLELHSNKASKVDVLSQLKNSWETKGEIDVENWNAEAQRLTVLRDQLNAYVDRLHIRHSNGLSLYEAMGRLSVGNEIPQIRLVWGHCDQHTLADMNAIRSIVDRLELNAIEVGKHGLNNHIFEGIEQTEWSPAWQSRLVIAARDGATAAEKLLKNFSQLCHLLRLPEYALNEKTQIGMIKLNRALLLAAGKDWRFAVAEENKRIVDQLKIGKTLLISHTGLSNKLLCVRMPNVLADLRKAHQLIHRLGNCIAKLSSAWDAKALAAANLAVKQIKEIEILRSRLSVRYEDSIEQLDLASMKAEYSKAESAFWPKSWAMKRKLQKVLKVHSQVTPQLNVSEDLRIWCQIRQLRSEISKHDLHPALGSMWAGLETNPDVLGCAIKFQETLALAKEFRKWDGVEFEIISNGTLSNFKNDLVNLRLMKELGVEIDNLAHLFSIFGGFWRGVDTNLEELDAALAYVEQSSKIQKNGKLNHSHNYIANGLCGSNLQEDYQCLLSRGEIEDHLSNLVGLGEKTPGIWNGFETSISEIEQSLEFHTAISVAKTFFSDDAEQLSSLKKSLDLLLNDADGRLSVGGSFHAASLSFEETLNHYLSMADLFIKECSDSESVQLDIKNRTVGLFLEKAKNVLGMESRLNSWCAWRRVRAEALVLNLGPLIEFIESESFGSVSLSRVFETNYSRWWINAAVEREPIIKNFVAVEHEKRIKDFRTLDNKLIELTKMCVRARLCANLPSQEGITRNSEWGIIRHELSKKKRHMPLRELISSTPTVFTRLAPCLLMSPLSIAQYLATDTTLFDLVIFDEASQIPVWDAIGAMARGRQVIMIGDPKQLPPSNFFDRGDSGSEDEEADLESILDECIGANLPTLNLSWHYRSKSESLIAFSNYRYYGGSLVTFPSPVTKDKAVSFQFISETYEKGAARVNKAEARTLVTNLVQRLKSPGFRESRMTIGVVTFNGEQQRLIENLLDDERRKDPFLECYFADSELEPIFVKNLESVQGDERDIIYFSITFGPDLAGAISMNFGPLNKDGGERRLNVAITRARAEMIVYSSLRSENIDLSRTNALGVRDLKLFLRFSEIGRAALAEETTQSLGGFESPLEEMNSQALTRKGWIVHTQIGVSSFRVDLAIVHPDLPGTYLAGVECDGATYHRSATARDRDKLREQVLRSLGWEIVRVWSTDWWIDAAGTLEVLDKKLNVLLQVWRTKREQQDAKSALQTPVLPEQILFSADEVSSSATEKEIRNRKSISTERDLARIEASPDSLGNGSSEVRASEIKLASTFKVFLEADPKKEFSDEINADLFFDKKYDKTLMKIIAYVIDIEGPILDVVLSRRIARGHGWQRNGTKIQERIDKLASKLHFSTKEENGRFYWSSEAAAKMPIPFRKPLNDHTRVFDEICFEELISLARSILSLGIPEASLIPEMAKSLNLSRISPAVRERLAAALKKAMLNP